MIEDIVISKNNVSIRLTNERWVHIVENHDDMAGYYDDILNVVENPDYIIQGYGNALVALKVIGRRKFLAVIYKEMNKNDGFIITAYFTKRIKLEKEVTLWKK